eukprot:15471502-Alexandrium_andersonii.AAC.1
MRRRWGSGVDKAAQTNLQRLNLLEFLGLGILNEVRAVPILKGGRLVGGASGASASAAGAAGIGDILASLDLAGNVLAISAVRQLGQESGRQGALRLLAGG